MKNLRPKILAIDDDPVYLDQVPDILESVGEVFTAQTIQEGLKLLEANFFDVVLLDLNFDNDVRSGLDVFRSIQILDRGTDVILISGETDPKKIIEVFNFGITRFISKPSSVDTIRNEVREVLNQRQLRHEVLSLEMNDGKDAPLNPLLGESNAIRAIREQVSLLVNAGVRDLLIQGETGTGKEKLARYIAFKMDPSLRFIPIHCGAISDGIAESELFGHTKGSFTGADRDKIGIFEAAAGGFVFLDELGEMPLIQQTKLLRVIQERVVQRVGSYEERKVNFRAIYATNLDLENAVKQKTFREDLFYRISKQVIRLPALRDRKEDIGFLLNSFKIKNLQNEPLEFTPEVIISLRNYSWPGNIRQLRDVAERLGLHSKSPVIRLGDLYKAAPEFASLENTQGQIPHSTILLRERRKFLAAIENAEGDRNVAAKSMGLSRSTFFRRAKELGVSKSR